MLELVKKAHMLKSQGMSMTEIESDIGIARAYIPKLLELYEEMEAAPVKSNAADYVCIRKQKYILLSLKIQHKLNDMRLEYAKHKKILVREKSKLINAKYSLGDKRAIIEELEQKQLMLNITSSNLNHAEDGYEYIKQEWNYTKGIYFLYGMGFIMTIAIIYGNFFGKIMIS
ncbi:hypothetical protein KKG72_04700 [bacterium]|nr:hypothetical protein [bacterium]